MTAARMTFWLPDVSEAKKNIMLLFVSGKKWIWTDNNL